MKSWTMPPLGEAQLDHVADVVEVMVAELAGDNQVLPVAAELRLQLRAVAYREGAQIGDRHQVTARRQLEQRVGTVIALVLGEGEGDTPGDLQSAHGHRLGAAGVLDFDVLEVPVRIAGIGNRVAGGDLGRRGGHRVVHHFGDADIRGQVHVKGHVGQGAPGAPGIDAGVDLLALRERDGPGIQVSGRADRAADGGCGDERLPGHRRSGRGGRAGHRAGEGGRPGGGVDGHVADREHAVVRALVGPADVDLLEVHQSGARAVERDRGRRAAERDAQDREVGAAGPRIAAVGRIVDGARRGRHGDHVAEREGVRPAVGERR